MVRVSKNRICMSAEATSPTVMSDGLRLVCTVTSMSPKLTGGAWSPPSPWPNAAGTESADRTSSAYRYGLMFRLTPDLI